MNAVNNFFSNIGANPELRFIITAVVVLVVFIIVWLLLRNIRLWYWKSDKMIDALTNLNERMNVVEDNLDRIKITTEILMNQDVRYLENAKENENIGLNVARQGALEQKEREALESGQKSQPAAPEPLQGRMAKKAAVKANGNQGPGLIEGQASLKKKAESKLELNKTREISRQRIAETQAETEMEAEAALLKAEMGIIADKTAEFEPDAEVINPKRATKMDSQLQGVEAALKELQRQKEQLEADLNARIRL